MQILIQAILLIAFFVPSQYAKKYTCVFDQLYKDYDPSKHNTGKSDERMSYPQIKGRQLQVSSRTPIRITLDTSNFTIITPGANGAADTTATHLNFIKKAMNVAESFFQSRLQVSQLSKIFSPLQCFDFQTPTNDQTNGIASSDLHIYIRYVTDKSITFGATGIHCKSIQGDNNPDPTFQAGRPTVGRIIFNTYTLLEDVGISNDEALLTNRRFAEITATAIHETMHILGFNSQIFHTYLDPSSSGTPYGSTTSGPIQLNDNRPQTYLLTTPKVTQWARSHYNCQSISGMQLENEDSFQPGSHWQRVSMYDEIMTATQLGAQKGFTGLTFALLKDMGWYNVDDTFADTTNYGQKNGCGFYNDACYGTQQQFPKYFCSAQKMAGISECSSTFLGKATCLDQTALMADGCGIWAEYHHCVDPDQNDEGFQSATIEVYGTESFCIQSTLATVSISQNTRSRCYQFQCDSDSQPPFIKFFVGSYVVNCLSTEKNTKKTIGALAGYLTCPDFNDFCTQSRKICPNWCSQNGFCSNGICNCKLGFSGDDCSVTLCSNKYYNPKDGTCDDNCPSKTYQNVYSKTCLPCGSNCDECIGQPDICTKCLSSIQKQLVFYNEQCYESCPEGTYLNGDSCQDCTSNCKTCFGDASNCTSCKQSLFLSGKTSGTCNQECENQPYIMKDMINYICTDTCRNNLVQDGGNCVLCQVGQFKRLDGCHSSCQQGYYANSEDRFCDQCHESCKFCDDRYAENCTACKSDRSDRYLLLKMCVNKCPTGYYANDTSGACELCTTTLKCSSCFVDSAGDDTVKCLSCKYGTYLQANNTCLTGCDPKYYKNRWNHSCDACSSDCGDCTSPYDSSCTNCDGLTGKYFLSNQTGGYCLDSCPSLQYVENGLNCLPCHKTCETCNDVGSSSCVSCVKNKDLYLYQGYCRYVCPELTYPSNETYTCDDCDSQCKFCFGSTVNNCTSCIDGLVLNSYTCQAACPEGMVANDWKVCVKFGQRLMVICWIGAIIIGIGML